MAGSAEKRQGAGQPTRRLPLPGLPGRRLADHRWGAVTPPGCRASVRWCGARGWPNEGLRGQEYRQAPMLVAHPR